LISLSGKTVLITGGARGLGKACAVMFSDTGAMVGINYLQSDSEADSVKKEIEKHNGTCKLFKGDISNENEAENIVNRFIKEFGRLDILINNAGIWKRAPIDNMGDKELSETLDINLKGTFFVTRYTIVQMKKFLEGSIINISSTAGQRGEAYYSHYAASKGAIQSFTKSLAVELAPYNIRVNCVAPGWMYTDMCKDVIDNDKEDRIIKQIPLGRIAHPEDVAGAVLFLASELAGFVTGEILNVNGGSVLCS